MLNVKVYCVLFIYLISVLSFVSCISQGSGVVDTLVKVVKCDRVQSVTSDRVQRSYSGRVEAVADVNLSFRVAGVVDRVLVREGAFVTSGQVVAELDSRDYELQLTATQAEYDAIKGEVDRVVELYSTQSIAENDYQKAVNGLKQIEAKLESHRNALGDTKLKAPFDGYIQRINYDRGEALSAGMPIASFVSASAPKITIHIPMSEYMRRDQLSHATAMFLDYPGKIFPLRSIGVSQKSNLNQLYECYFEFEPCGGVYPGLGVLAMVKLQYGDEQELCTIPLSAVIERDGESYVWVVERDVVKLRAVSMGHVLSSGLVTIVGGLAAEEVVVTAGVKSLKEGEQVRPLPTPSKYNVGNIL